MCNAAETGIANRNAGGARTKKSGVSDENLLL
jgi:hypothetical protein